MIKRVKTTKHSSIDSKSAKVVDFYPDLFFMKQMPVSEAFIDRLAQEMIEFAEKKDTIRPSQFWLSKRMNSTYITRWKEKWPQLQMAYDFLVASCAMRRDVGAATRKLDGSYIKDTQVLYDKEWRDQIEWRSKLNVKEDIGIDGKFVLQMIKAPNSTEVPDRNKE